MRMLRFKVFSRSFRLLIFVLLMSLLMQIIPVEARETAPERTESQPASQLINSTSVNSRSINELETEQEDPVVTFPDTGLEIAIRNEIDKETGDIYQSDLDSMFYLYAAGCNISDLSGIENCHNLIELYLYSNQIDNISNLVELSNLKYLNLSVNQLNSLEGMPELPGLGSLDLSNNQISSLTGMPELTSLNYLALSDNQMNSLEGMPELPILEYLYLYRNQLNSLEGMPELPGLGSLDLSNNRITNLSGMPEFSKLEYLNLSGNQMNSLEGMPELPKLGYLFLNDNQMNSLEGMPELPSLRELYLYNNQIANLTGMPELPELEELDMRYNQISSLEGIPELSKLEFLILCVNQLNSLEGMPELPELEYLDVSDNQISSLTGMPELPELSDLVIINNQISSLSGMPELPELYDLDLGNNQISDLTGMPVLPKLQWLGLSENQIKNLIGMPELTNLNGLVLRDNQISSLSGMPELPELYSLDLINNRINDLSGLENLTKLFDVDLSNNQISDISLLVANPGLGSGDYIFLTYNYLDLTAGSVDMVNIQTLRSRGVEVEYKPQNKDNAPVVNLGEDVSIDQGSTFTSSGSFSDEDSSSWTAKVNYGDSPEDFDLTLTEKSFNLSHVFKTAGEYMVTVTVTDNQGASGTGYLIVTVNEKTIDITPETLPDGEVKLTYKPVTLTLTGVTGTYTWTWKGDTGSATPSGLKLKANKDTLSAVISGKPTKAGTYSFKVTATDKKDKTKTYSRSYEIKVIPALAITTEKVVKGEIGEEYSLKMNASGGKEPYNWTISKGELPPGLHLSNLTVTEEEISGEEVYLAGTPSAVGSYTFTVQVTDGQEGVVSKALKVKIYDELRISEMSLPGCDVGVTYKTTTLKASGGIKRYKWTIVEGELPEGIELSDKGVIKGKAAEGTSGEYKFRVEVTDDIEGTATKEFTLKVNDLLVISVEPEIADNVTVGETCSYTFKASGGSGTGYKWTRSGSLPKGLKLVTNKEEPGKCTITGTYTKAGKYTFTLKLKDSLKGQGIFTVILNVK